LIDSKANGGLAGDDVRILDINEHIKIDVTGIANNDIDNLKLAQVAGVVNTMSDGPAVLIFLQYTLYRKGRMIHSKMQMEHFGCLVNDCARINGDTQSLVTPEGHGIPLSIREGLFYMDMHAPNNQEMETLPHVFVTSDSPWDPSVIDYSFSKKNIKTR
jgi:hypothetical protein